MWNLFYRQRRVDQYKGAEFPLLQRDALESYPNVLFYEPILESLVSC